MFELSPSLIASQFRNDPRVAQAKELLFETLKDYQHHLNKIKPPQNDLKISYQHLLESFAECRGAPLYFPYLGSGFGSGVFVELADGSVKYDLISGIGPHYWGHSHPDLLLSNLDAALSNTIMQGHLQQNVEAYELSKLLVELSGFEHCFLSSTGAMANENAMKMIFQKKYPANRILAFDHCFMGRTLTLAQITDKASFRDGLPLNTPVDYIPFYDPDEPEKSTQAAVQALQNHLTRYPKKHALMCFELIQGEAGFYAGTTDFFTAIMKILKEAGIAILDDEIQTFGRTPNLFAYQYFGLEEYIDMVSIGKLSQICATLFRDEYKPRAGLLSQTFIGSTSAIYASLTILSQLCNDNYLGPKGKIAQTHAYFVSKLMEIEKRHPDLIQGPYGLGSMIAFTPFKGEDKRVARFVQDLFQEGVISFIAGQNPTRVRFLIPIGAIKNSHIDEVAQIIERVLTV